MSFEGHACDDIVGASLYRLQTRGNGCATPGVAAGSALPRQPQLRTQTVGAGFRFPAATGFPAATAPWATKREYHRASGVGLPRPAAAPRPASAGSAPAVPKASDELAQLHAALRLVLLQSAPPAMCSALSEACRTSALGGWARCVHVLLLRQHSSERLACWVGAPGGSPVLPSHRGLVAAAAGSHAAACFVASPAAAHTAHDVAADASLGLQRGETLCACSLVDSERRVVGVVAALGPGAPRPRQQRRLEALCSLAALPLGHALQLQQSFARLSASLGSLEPPPTPTPAAAAPPPAAREPAAG